MNKEQIYQELNKLPYLKIKSSELFLRMTASERIKYLLSERKVPFFSTIAFFVVATPFALNGIEDFITSNFDSKSAAETLISSKSATEIENKTDGSTVTNKKINLVSNNALAKLIVDGAEFKIDSIKAEYENQSGEYAKQKRSEYAQMLGKALCDGAICLSITDYKDFCQIAKGVTKKSIGGITLFDSVTKYLIDNGSFDGANISWETFTTTEGKHAGRCIVTVSGSGIYEGSSRRQTAEAQVSRFAIVDGQVLVSEAYPTYTNYELAD